MLLATISALESRLSEKDKQLAALTAENKGLHEQNETLTQEVRHHKWEHILTKSTLTRTKKRLDKSLKEIAKLQDALRIARLPQNSSNSSRPPSCDLYKPGIKARKHFYPDGLPYAILISYCLAMQLSTPAAAHQLCLVHLLRELNALVEIHPGRKWPAQFKRLLLRALQLRDYPYYDSKVKKVEKDLRKLLKTNQANAPGKIPAFWRRMNTHHNKILTFLGYTDVPAHNNASYPNFLIIQTFGLMTS